MHSLQSAASSGGDAAHRNEKNYLYLIYFLFLSGLLFMWEKINSFLCVHLYLIHSTKKTWNLKIAWCSHVKSGKDICTCDDKELKLKVLALQKKKKNIVQREKRESRKELPVMSLHHLPLSTTQAQKNGFPGSPNMVRREWGVQQMSHLPDSHIRQPCMCARQREEGKKRGWREGDSERIMKIRAKREKKKTAEATFEQSSGVHTARSLRAPRGVNVTGERMQRRSLWLGDVNVSLQLLTRRSSLKTNSCCPLDSVRHALCSTFGVQNYVAEWRMKCTCMDCTFHAHLFLFPEQGSNHVVKDFEKWFSGEHLNWRHDVRSAMMYRCTLIHVKPILSWPVVLQIKKKTKKQSGGLLNIKICRQLLFESLALHLTHERFAFGGGMIVIPFEPK